MHLDLSTTLLLVVDFSIEMSANPTQSVIAAIQTHKDANRVVWGLAQTNETIKTINGHFAEVAGRKLVLVTGKYCDRYVFRPNEVAMLLKNDTKLNVVNGDRVVLIRKGYKDGAETLVVRVIDDDRIVDLPMSYARLHLAPTHSTNIHKSQGGEVDHVVMSLDNCLQLQSQESLYTGITRAKKSVKIFVNSMAKIEGSMIQSQKRQTHLGYFLKLSEEVSEDVVERASKRRRVSQ